MNKKFFVIFGVFLLISLGLTSVTAGHIEQQSSYDPQGMAYISNGYVIAPITIPVGQVGKNISIWFRTYDDSGKVILTTNTAVQCSAFMFTPNGDEIYRLDGNGNLSAVSPTGRKADIPGYFFEEEGDYVYFVACEGVSVGGWFQGVVTVTETGVEPADGTVVVFFSILFIVIVVTMLSLLMNTIFMMIAWDFDAKDLIFNVSAYFGIFATYILSKNYLGSLFVNEFLVWFLGIGAFTMVILPLIAFFMNIVKGNLKSNE